MSSEVRKRNWLQYKFNVLYALQSVILFVYIMSNIPNTDILQALPFEKWPLLRNKLKYNWPTFAYYYYWVENSIKWKKKDPNISIQIYCPNGNYEDGTFIGISNYSMYLVMIFTLDPSTEAINKILAETKVIDWSQPLNFATVHASFAPNVLSAIKDLQNLSKVGKEDAYPFNFYFKPAEECASTKIWMPEECYAKALDKSDVPLIHSVWPHKDPVHPELSTKYLSTLIEMNGGMGLYLKDDDSLVSWAIHNDWHGLGIVQTVERHKRRGYAKSVVNILSKKLGEQGISVTLFIVDGNTASEIMFKDLGWKAIAPFVWIMFEKQQTPNLNS